ncbi:unnamed protein product [Cochlearia groenlandica]
MLRNVLRAIVPHAPDLSHVCLQTGTNHYAGPLDNNHGGYRRREAPFTEDMPRLEIDNYYYTLEDVLLEEIKTTRE